MQSNTQHLIIGASGKTGSRVLQGLKERGFNPIGASRHGDVYFDWNEPESWSRALHGVDSVYLTYYPDLAVPKAPEDIAKFCALAKIKGVKHITLLSGRGEPAAQICESIVQQSGLSSTVVRASWFNQNFSEGMFRDYIVGGTIALPVSVITEPFVDVDDIADVVIASLTEAGHTAQLYEVTGPELLSFAQLAARFTELLGTPVQFVQVTLEQFVESLQQHGVDSGAIDMLQYLFTEVLDGRNEYIADGVQQALGRPPRSFNQFILNNAQAFARAE